MEHLSFSTDLPGVRACRRPDKLSFLTKSILSEKLILHFTNIFVDFKKAFDIVNLASTSTNKNGWVPSNKIYSRWGLVSDALNEKYAAFRSDIFDYHYGIDIFAQNKEVGQAKIVELIDGLYDLLERTGIMKSVLVQTFFNAKYGEITDHLKGYPDRTIFTKLKKIDPSHAGRYDLSSP